VPEKKKKKAPIKKQQLTDNEDISIAISKKIANDRNSVDTSKGSGENGRIVKSDVENFYSSSTVSPTQAQT
jgi:pyruvate dehydrogenase E2 component (dihydrolipoamide acetyltransferase)